MHSLEPEILRLREEGLIAAPAAAGLFTHERREVVSVYGELRFLIWGGVMLIATGVGIIVSKNLDRIGPIAIATLIALAAGACYAWTAWKRTRAASLADDYVLLLGSLLLSADVGYIEHQWHLLGPVWPRHFLLLAVIHGAVAYWFGSRMVLSLSISALAAWFGIERRGGTIDSAISFALRAYLCAGTLLVWRAIDSLRKPVPRGSRPAVSFSPILDHAALNLAFWGSLALVFEPDSRSLGCLIALVLAAFSAWYGFRRREERYVLYAWVYGTIALDVQVASWLGFNDGSLILLYLMVSTVCVIGGLIVTHDKLRRRLA